MSQYVDAVLGEGQLYRYMHAVFDADYPPSSLHHFLARVATTLRESGRKQQLIVTTNYDDLLERAFEEQGEKYDLVWYEAKRGGSQGQFRHRAPSGVTETIDTPNKYMGLNLEERTTILKLHGALDRNDPKGDSFVITEDNYIDYLANRPSGEIPVVLQARMEESHFLFLGYSLRDWNLRVVLNRIWRGQILDLKSWAIQREPDLPSTSEIEQTLWRDRGAVELHYVALREYVQRLERELFDGNGAAPEPAA